jgi:lipoate-protein ligase A
VSAPAWRLIVDGPVAGATNMAVDRAVLACRSAGSAPATLRLYRWQVPTVTLGRFQPESDVDLEACERRGVDVVRRPTGGRGVLHDDEITYSIVAGTADGIPRGTAASYRHLCGAVADAYRRMGVEAELTARVRGSRASGACYLHATAADLSLGAAKLSGSAQVWKGDAVLQHGSFVITRDPVAEAEVFGLGEGGAGALDGATATIVSVLGSRPSWDRIVEAVAAAVSSVLEVRLEPGELNDEERERAAGWASEHLIRHARRGGTGDARRQP